MRAGILVSTLGLAALFAIGGVPGDGAAAGKEKTVMGKSFDLPIGVSVKEVLQKLKSEDREVTIVLKNGATYAGQLADVKDGKFIQVIKIKGKDFFDVLIDMNEIAAVEYRRE